MKILVISESSTNLESYSDFFVKNGFNTISYSWLLKALDNILEIKPDSVVINSIDYPRHWKTLVQYVRSVYTGVSVIVLIVPETISEDEQKKIDALNVHCVHEDFIDTNEGQEVLKLLNESGKMVTEGDFKLLDFIEDQDRQKHVYLEQSVEDYVNELNAKIALENNGIATETDLEVTPNALEENTNSSAEDSIEIEDEIDFVEEKFEDPTNHDFIEVQLEENVEIEPQTEETFAEDAIEFVDGDIEALDIEETVEESVDVYEENIIDEVIQEEKVDNEDLVAIGEHDDSVSIEVLPNDLSNDDFNKTYDESVEESPIIEAEEIIESDEIFTGESSEDIFTNSSIIEEEVIEESLESDSMYFEDTVAEEDIFEDDEPNTDYGTWLECPIEESNATIFGEVISYEHPIIQFSPKDKEQMSYFHFGKKIASCTLTDDGYPSIITVQVQGFEDDSVELCVVK